MDSSVSVSIQAGAMVCAGTVFRGDYDIIIGAGTVVQPGVTIDAKNGPVFIGENNIIEENVTIANSSNEGEPLSIGKMNLFCVGAQVSRCTIGNINIFEPKCIVGDRCVVGNAASIGPTVELYPDQTVEDETVLVRSERPVHKTRFQALPSAASQAKEKEDVYDLETILEQKPPMMKERNISRVQRYLEALRDEGGRSCMKKQHKFKPPTA